MNHAFLRRLLLVSSLLTVTHAAAQCPAIWASGSPVRGTNGRVMASTWWDPDGAGPLGQRLVLVGDFTVVADVAAQRIVAWDPATDVWAPLGSGLNGIVRGVEALANGDLFVVGDFNMAGGVSATRVARYHGGLWSALGSGITSSAWPWVKSVVALPGGDIVVAGEFLAAGGQPANRVARWNGTAWSPLGSGVNGYVNALHVRPNGDLIAAGYFTMAGTLTVNKVARWDGVTWSALGSGLGNDPVSNEASALGDLANGDLVVGGPFSTAGGVGVNGIARWNGSNWSAFGGGLVGAAESTLLLSNGALVVAALTSSGGVPSSQLRRWNGVSWVVVAPAIEGNIHAIVELPGGDLLVAGSFTTVSGIPANNLARWNGTSWAPVRSGFDQLVRAVAALADGSVVVAGPFTRAPGVLASGVARWHAGSWSPLGSGVLNPFGVGLVNAIVQLPSGDVVVGGHISHAGGVPANGVARWNGSSWSPLGLGVAGTVQALAVMPNGNLLVAGSFTSAGGASAQRIARWDGSNWWPLGGGLTSGIIESLLCVPNGDVVAGGTFSTAQGAPGNFVMRWNGTSWGPMGAGTNGTVRALLLDAGGQIVAGGSFTSPAGRVARWNGSSWQTIGSGLPDPYPHVEGMVKLANGDLVAGGELTAIGPNLARWNGVTWSPFAGGVHGSGVYSLAALPGGSLIVGGHYTEVGPTTGRVAAAGLAMLLPGCPATATAYGNGCVGSAGPNVLTSATLPWLGRTCTSQATGMPALSLAVDVIGFAPVVLPLSSVSPHGGAACDLLASPDTLGVQVPVAGVAISNVAIPNAASLLGTVFHQQVVAIELDAAGNLIAMTSTNALALRIGDI